MAMKQLTLETVARVTGGRYVGDDASRSETITGVVRDNREAYAGCLFLCFRGARADGHDYANKAYDAGAVCCLAERELNEPKGPYVLVESTLAAVRALGAYYRSLFDIPVVGVIGSVGKTTAKEMTAAVLSQKFSVLKTTANLNNELGVPLTLLSLDEAHEAAVIEMGISNFGEMSRIAEMVRPDICLMTVIGYSHLESLGDLDGVLRAKSEVFRYMRRDALAVVNGDDKLLKAFDPGIRKITFGLNEDNDYRAVNVTALGIDGVKCGIVNRNGTFEVSIPAFGSHMVYGALPAAAIGHALGLTDDEIREGLGRYEPVGGRANVFNTGYITIIDDCYNANPNSMAASIKSLASLEGRKVAVLGDMFELGGDTARLHTDMGELAAQSVDRLICCGELAENIRDGFVSAGGGEARYFSSKEALIEALPELIGKGDNVLVKASHGMHFEQITQALKALKQRERTMVLQYTAGQPDGGRKVYSIMRRELRISQTLTRRLKQAGGIRVDGRPVFTDYALKPDETVEIDITAAEPPCDIMPENGPLRILYEDAGLLAADKPAGMITHPSRARYTGTLSNFVAGYLEATTGDARCHAVNRLDRDTSGVVLFAKNSYMKALASSALGAPDAEKSYLALVLGLMEPPAGIIKTPIRRLREGDMLRVAAPDGQPAVTRYETLDVFDVEGGGISLLRLVLETGRTHQIRVHCLMAGHPVLGDGLYYTEPSREVSDKLGIVTQALHARSLVFTEPITGEKLNLTAELPEVFKRLCAYNQQGGSVMKDFPGFMKNPLNKVPSAAQNTADIEGYFFEGQDGSQMACWTCYADRESKKHTHPFDEYTIIVAGQYTARFEDGREIVLNPGDELYVPAGTTQWGRCVAGTRSIHAFGGRRISREA